MPAAGLDFRDAVVVVFGDAVATGTEVSEAEWIAPALGVFGTVGGVVPAGYESYLLIDYRAHGDAIGWDGVQRLFADLSARLASETSTPDACCFAIWEGYGFGRGTTAYAWYGDGVDRDEMDRLGREARESDAERLRRVTAALAIVPSFELPNRRYYLVTGSVTAAGRLTRPDDDGAQPPDLWWPRDRRWFVGGDTDLDWCYLAGSRELIDSIHQTPRWHTRLVARDWTNHDAGNLS